MKKPSASSGETVKELIPSAQSVKIVFVDGKSFTVSMGAYLDGPRIYPGKKLDKETIARLSESKEDIALYSYLLTLISSGRLYSKKKLAEKMMKIKKATYQQAEETIEKATRQGIINDGEFLREYIISAHDLGQSKEKILLDLSKEGYSDTKPREIYESLGLGDNKKEAVRQAFIKAHGRNIETRKANAAIRLVRLGYSYQEGYEAVSALLEKDSLLRKEAEGKQELALKSEFSSIFERLVQSGQDEKTAKTNTISRLLARKFNYDDIIEAAEEFNTK